MEFSQIFREVMELWQNPSETSLPLETLMNCGNRCVRTRFLELDLTPNTAFFAQKSYEFTVPNNQEKTLALDGLSRILRVESHSCFLDCLCLSDCWQEETITSYENWNEVKDRFDQRYVTFRGLPPNLKMMVNYVTDGIKFRVHYQQVQGQIADAEDAINLPEYFKNLLVYDIAIEVGELINDRSAEFRQLKSDKMPYLTLRHQEASRLIDQWRMSQKGVGVTTRRGFHQKNHLHGWKHNRRWF